MIFRAGRAGWSRHRCAGASRRRCPAPRGAGILGERVQAGERVGGDRRAQPLDRIAVVVVMRRLDHHEVEERRAPRSTVEFTIQLLSAPNTVTD